MSYRSPDQADAKRRAAQRQTGRPSSDRPGAPPRPTDVRPAPARAPAEKNQDNQAALDPVESLAGLVDPIGEVEPARHADEEEEEEEEEEGKGKPSGTWIRPNPFDAIVTPADARRVAREYEERFQARREAVDAAYIESRDARPPADASPEHQRAFAEWQDRVKRWALAEDRRVDDLLGTHITPLKRLAQHAERADSDVPVGYDPAQAADLFEKGWHYSAGEGSWIKTATEKEQAENERLLGIAKRNYGVYGPYILTDDWLKMNAKERKEFYKKEYELLKTKAGPAPTRPKGVHPARDPGVWSGYHKQYDRWNNLGHDLGIEDDSLFRIDQGAEGYASLRMKLDEKAGGRYDFMTRGEHDDFRGAAIAFHERGKPSREESGDGIYHARVGRPASHDISMARINRFKFYRDAANELKGEMPTYWGRPNYIGYGKSRYYIDDSIWDAIYDGKPLPNLRNNAAKAQIRAYDKAIEYIKGQQFAWKEKNLVITGAALHNMNVHAQIRRAGQEYRFAQITGWGRAKHNPDLYEQGKPGYLSLAGIQQVGAAFGARAAAKVAASQRQAIANRQQAREDHANVVAAYGISTAAGDAWVAGDFAKFDKIALAAGFQKMGVDLKVAKEAKGDHPRIGESDLPYHLTQEEYEQVIAKQRKQRKINLAHQVYSEGLRAGLIGVAEHLLARGVDRLPRNNLRMALRDEYGEAALLTPQIVSDRFFSRARPAGEIGPIASDYVQERRAAFATGYRALRSELGLTDLGAPSTVRPPPTPSPAGRPRPPRPGAPPGPAPDIGTLGTLPPSPEPLGLPPPGPAPDIGTLGPSPPGPASQPYGPPSPTTDKSIVAGLAGPVAGALLPTSLGSIAEKNQDNQAAPATTRGPTGRPARAGRPSPARPGASPHAGRPGVGGASLGPVVAAAQDELFGGQRTGPLGGAEKTHAGDPLGALGAGIGAGLSEMYHDVAGIAAGLHGLATGRGFAESAEEYYEEYHAGGLPDAAMLFGTGVVQDRLKDTPLSGLLGSEERAADAWAGFDRYATPGQSQGPRAGTPHGFYMPVEGGLLSPAAPGPLESTRPGLLRDPAWFAGAGTGFAALMAAPVLGKIKAGSLMLKFMVQTGSKFRARGSDVVTKPGGLLAEADVPAGSELKWIARKALGPGDDLTHVPELSTRERQVYMRRETVDDHPSAIIFYDKDFATRTPKSLREYELFGRKRGGLIDYDLIRPPGMVKGKDTKASHTSHAVDPDYAESAFRASGVDMAEEHMSALARSAAKEREVSLEFPETDAGSRRVIISDRDAGAPYTLAAPYKPMKSLPSDRVAARDYHAKPDDPVKFLDIAAEKTRRVDYREQDPIRSAQLETERILEPRVEHRYLARVDRYTGMSFSDPRRGFRGEAIDIVERKAKRVDPPRRPTMKDDGEAQKLRAAMRRDMEFVDDQKPPPPTRPAPPPARPTSKPGRPGTASQETVTTVDDVVSIISDLPPAGGTRRPGLVTPGLGGLVGTGTGTGAGTGTGTGTGAGTTAGTGTALIPDITPAPDSRTDQATSTTGVSPGLDESVAALTGTGEAAAQIVPTDVAQLVGGRSSTRTGTDTALTPELGLGLTTREITTRPPRESSAYGFMYLGQRRSFYLPPRETARVETSQVPRLDLVTPVKPREQDDLMIVPKQGQVQEPSFKGAQLLGWPRRPADATTKPPRRPPFLVGPPADPDSDDKKKKKAPSGLTKEGVLWAGNTLADSALGYADRAEVSYGASANLLTMAEALAGKSGRRASRPTATTRSKRRRAAEEDEWQSITGRPARGRRPRRAKRRSRSI